MRTFLSPQAAREFTIQTMGGEPHYLYTSTDGRTVYGIHSYTLSHAKNEPYVITNANGEKTEFVIDKLEVSEASRELVRTLLMHESYICNDVSRPLVINTLTKINKIFSVLDSKVLPESYDI